MHPRKPPWMNRKVKNALLKNKRLYAKFVRNGQIDQWLEGEHYHLEGDFLGTTFSGVVFWHRFQIWVLICMFGGLFRDKGGLSLFWGRAFCFTIYFKFISKNIVENSLSVKRMQSVLLVPKLASSYYWVEGLAKCPR